MKPRILGKLLKKNCRSSRVPYANSGRESGQEQHDIITVTSVLGNTKDGMSIRIVVRRPNFEVINTKDQTRD